MSRFAHKRLAVLAAGVAMSLVASAAADAKTFVFMSKTAVTATQSSGTGAVTPPNTGAGTGSTGSTGTGTTTPPPATGTTSTGSLTAAGATCPATGKTVLVRNVQAVVGHPLSLTVPTVCGGAAPYIYEPNDKPQIQTPGLLMDELSGELSGTPTQAGTYTETVYIFDNNSAEFSSPTFTITVTDH